MQMYHLCLKWKVAYPQIHFKRPFFYISQRSKSENKKCKKTFRYLLESRQPVKYYKRGKSMIHMIISQIDGKTYIIA